MLKFTDGPPDEMQILIACGIATYLVLFPIIIAVAVVCAEVMRRNEPDEPGAAGLPAQAPGHPRAAAALPREVEVANAV